jgi:uncharacterized ferritin-like protein (DUF455 family)
MSKDLFETADLCLSLSDAGEKVRVTRAAAAAWRAREFPLVAAEDNVHEPRPVGEPGRPQRPHLVAPRQLHTRSLYTKEGHAALIHAIAHIEFNAINLAWDAVYRFRHMPDRFYDDWVQVADEEAYHFQLVREHLNTLGFDYGDFDAHNGLWEMAQKTAHDPLVRMALVPRVLEARGLDVTPGIMKKLNSVGDSAAVEVLEVILRDEIGHVEIGSRWFQYLCHARSLPSKETFRRLFDQYMNSAPKGPLHREARLKAGFTKDELDYLEGGKC